MIFFNYEITRNNEKILIWRNNLFEITIIRKFSDNI